MDEKKRKKRGTGRLRKAVGGLLVAVAVLCAGGAAGLVAYNEYEDARASGAAQAVAENIEKEVLEVSRADEFLPDYMLDPTRDMPAVEVDGRRYVGVIEIPVLGLTLPVVEDWSYPGLKVAPCRYNSTAYREGFAICAHNYSRHFGKINTLETGNEVFFTDVDGNRFGYIVRETEILQPSDTAKVVYSDWPLTLFTCTLGGQTRFTVRCDRLEGQTGFELE